MLEARLYHIIYLLVISVLTFICLRRYSFLSKQRVYNGKYSSSLLTIILLVALIGFIGFRPVSLEYFVDMYNYDLTWYARADSGYQWNWNTDNILFDNLFGLLSGAGLSSRFWFVFIAIIYFGGIAWACFVLFPKDKLCSFLVYLAAFSTFAYATNGIKAGAAASLFLVAVAFYDIKKYVGAIVFLLFSLGFHHAMILPVTAFIVCMVIKRPQLFQILWILCLIMALFRVTYFQHLFSGLVDEHGSMYLIGDGESVQSQILGGFRIDFILYSIVPIIVGAVAINVKKIHSRSYLFILNLYTLINAIWLLCMYAEFTNRIAYLSWLLYPIVLIFPFLRENWGKRQYRSFMWVGYAHLAFTLFMVFLYNG